MSNALDFVVEVVTKTGFHVKLDFNTRIAKISHEKEGFLLTGPFVLNSVHSDVFFLQVGGIAGLGYLAEERYLSKLRPFLNAIKPA